MVAPGAGMGNTAAAVARIGRVYDVLLNTLPAFPRGSKEQQAVMRAASALNSLFGGDKAAEAGPAAGQQMMQQGLRPNPALAGTPNPGLNLAPMRGLGQAAGQPMNQTA